MQPTTPNPDDVQALAAHILARRAEHAATRAARAAKPIPVAAYCGTTYPLGTPIYALAGYPARIERIGVIAGVSLTDPTRIVAAPAWHTGAPVHRYENSREDKRHILGHYAWPSWALAHDALTRGAERARVDAERRLADAQAECARVAAMTDPTITPNPES